MKKISTVFAMILVMVSVVPAFADLEWADPALCVDGQWLVIDAGADEAITVMLPSGSQYGDGAAGGCDTPAPAPVLPNTSVQETGGGHMLLVRVDGGQASSPVTVSYAGDSQTRTNHGGQMVFQFGLN